MSRPEKILFPKDKITKADLAGYYKKAWKRMSRHFKDRPLVMQRFPNGIDKEGFFQKNVGEYFPNFIPTIKVPKKENGMNELVLCNSLKTLLFLADQAVITFHLWLSKKKDLNRPDKIVFDLDPPKGVSFAKVVKLAKLLRDLIEEESFPMLTGSRGLHIILPLKGKITYEESRQFAKEVAEMLEKKYPSLCTTTAKKEKREGKIYIDTNRNGYAQLSVAPYSVRAKDGAPIALPISWEGLGKKGLRSDSFTIKDIDKILRKPDPWASMR